MEDNDSELLHIYDNIVLKNLSCCGICFRVDNQSGLVPPKAIKDLIEVLNLPGEFITQIRVVCYVCEAHANRALRFHSVVSMADRLHGLFHKMLIRKSFEKQVRECLKTCRGPKIFNSEVHKNALDCEEQMKKVRSRCRLQQTEILNIDTELVDSSGEDNSLVMSMQNITPQCNPIMETLVILDDEDEPKVNEGKIVSTTEVKCDKPPMNTPKLVPIEKLLQPPRPTQNFMPMFTNPMPLLQPENPSYMLHPIVMGRDGSFNVPSLSATLVGGLVYQNNTNPLLLMNASDPSIFAGNQNNSAVLVGNKEQSTGLVGNKEKSTISVGNKDQSAILVGNKVESAILVRNKELSTILVENKDNSSVLVGKEDITNTTKKKKSPTILNKTMAAQDELPSVVIKEGSVTSTSIEDDLETILRKAVEAFKNHNKRSCDESSGTSKRAKESVNGEKEKERESRIDWEDRIPMGVISFMDPVDPHADSKLQSDSATNKPGPSASTGQVDPPDAMGVITEVRSVKTESFSTQTNHRMDDFIDLC